MKKLFILFILASFAIPLFAQSNDLELTTSKLERYLYGTTLSGNIGGRLRQIEEDLFGHVTGQTDADKADYLNNFIFKGTETDPSLDMKLNFLEWRIYNNSITGTLEERLARIDQQMVGGISTEPLAFRLEQLVHLNIEDGLISISETTIPRGTHISVELAEAISSKSVKKNDMVPLIISDNLFLNGNLLVMGKGGIATANVKSIRRGGRFGRTGYVSLGLDNIESMDSTTLPVAIADSAQEKFDFRQIGKAVGASTIGYYVLGPLGVAGGALIKGEDIALPRGTTLSLTTTKDLKVKGVYVPKT